MRPSYPDKESGENQESQPKKRGCCFWSILVLVLTIIAVLWIYCFSHDWNLWRLDRSYSLLSYPPGTQHIEHHKEIGLLVGNGNHCDYFVGDLRSYSGDKNNIVKFYKNKTIWNPISHTKQSVIITFIDDLDKLQHDNSGLYDISVPSPIEDILRSIEQQDRKHYYVVYVLDAGYPTGLDIRGC